MPFKTMSNLDEATEEQKQEYYLAACEHLQVPPELNLLAFIWLDSRDDGRHLVLYAKKGATDLIRAKRGITTKSLTMQSGPGFVNFIAEGADADGRVEMASGTASIDGLKGQKLEAAVMVAQTRATRRMTLQFVGGGLLDESEVNQSTTDINRVQGPLSAIAPIQPAVTPNAKPGKDVTKIDRDDPSCTNMIPTPAQQAAQDALKLSLPKLTADAPTNVPNSLQTAPVWVPTVTMNTGDTVGMPNGQQAKIIEAGPEKRKRKARKTGIDLGPGVSANTDKAESQPTPTFDAGGPPNVQSKPADIKEDTAPAVTAQNPPIQGVSLQTTADIKADKICHLFGCANAAKDGAFCEQHTTQKAVSAVAVVAPSAPIVAPSVPVVTHIPTTLPAVPAGAVKTARQRLLEYANLFAETCKMSTTEGIGGPGNKLRVFASKQMKADWTTFTGEQWTAFLDYLDQQVKELGAMEVSKTIDEVVTAS